MADRVTFTPGSAERIAKVVRIVEAGNRNTGWRPPAPRVGGGGTGTKVIQGFTDNNAWAYGATRAITVTSGSTAVASNLLYDIHEQSIIYLANCKPSDGEPGDWRVIGAGCEYPDVDLPGFQPNAHCLGGQDLTKIESFDSTKVQVLVSSGSGIYWTELAAAAKSAVFNSDDRDLSADQYLSHGGGDLVWKDMP